MIEVEIQAFIDLLNNLLEVGQDINQVRKLYNYLGRDENIEIKKLIDSLLKKSMSREQIMELKKFLKKEVIKALDDKLGNLDDKNNKDK